ncbi:hypothetical protein CYMTET_30587 [Cymbomonas tetramitiformis]|uniref:Sulfotransferase n=1 Tax=Cymbomonas tetramitiformis TaxID=36881 RepID=A0AAE0FII2_9CHLO|nr:hypothetical protein CYMTET_30587 [Cymbomonas tetramitiformis]
MFLRTRLGWNLVLMCFLLGTESFNEHEHMAYTHSSVKLANNSFFQMHKTVENTCGSLPGTSTNRMHTAPSGDLGHLCLPHFIYIGMGHSGSTTLLKWLSTHPQVVVNSKAHKRRVNEPWFFNKIWKDSASLQENRLQYARIFPRIHSVVSQRAMLQVLGEKTPTYWSSSEVPGRIKKLLPHEPRFLMLLRNPTSWAYSRWARPVGQPQGSVADGIRGMLGRLPGAVGRNWRGNSAAKPFSARANSNLTAPQAFHRRMLRALDPNTLRSPMKNLYPSLPGRLREWFAVFPREHFHFELTGELLICFLIPPQRLPRFS